MSLQCEGREALPTPPEFFIMNISTSAIVNMTEGFPPAHKLAQHMASIDYVKHLNNFMEAVEIAIAIVAMVCDVAVFVWDNGGQEFLQEMALNFCQKVRIGATFTAQYTVKFAVWFIEVAVPAVENAIESTIAAGKKTREVWEMLNSPMFASL